MIKQDKYQWLTLEERERLIYVQFGNTPTLKVLQDNIDLTYEVEELQQRLSGEDGVSL